MNPLLWGAVVGAVIWAVEEIHRARKRRRLVAEEALRVAAAAQREESAHKRKRQQASKERVHFEKPPVELKLGGDTWTEVWMDDTVAFQNERTGEILQDGEEFAKLQGQS